MKVVNVFTDGMFVQENPMYVQVEDGDYYRFVTTDSMDIGTADITKYYDDIKKEILGDYRPMMEFQDIKNTSPLMQDLFWRVVNSLESTVYVEYEEKADLEEAYGMSWWALHQWLMKDIQAYGLEDIIKEGDGDYLLTAKKELQTVFKFKEWEAL